jgi:hypothetical protein
MTFISKTNYLLITVIFIFPGCSKKPKHIQKSGNPVFEGWYADPEGMVFGDEFWIFPTYSDDFEKQVFFDAIFVERFDNLGKAFPHTGYYNYNLGKASHVGAFGGREER